MNKGISEEFKRLYTYCGLNKNGDNIVAKISDVNGWKKEYLGSFKKSYISELEKPNSVRLLYCDPDTTYKKGFDHHFFEQLVNFLNKRECQLKDKLKGEYEYIFEEGKGIKVNNESFYLKSDQLGFSAPTNEKVYPYDLYLMKSGDKDDALEQVVNWIIGSRTIGGSFLWPASFYEIYNMRRGGTIKSNRSHYIQDRVDLTLWEIYYWYNKNEKSTIMTKVKDKQAEKDLKKWLSHFKDFQTYIDFFCLEEFSSKEKSIKDAIPSPINILSDKIEEPKWGEKGENPKIEITSDVEFITIEGMLKRLNNKILNRSKKMEQIISSECNKNSNTK
jgi:hypothetical protein